ncbi:hypothetical protein [Pantoea cypripedii]|uniref:Uncharacterized protein n=1 Tax=Pantoea cypripedii TaxID=55209 RepID=A0A6B9FXV1_PANCY|nr:hypothetical protein [Pantoea cypripedii]QGY29371.1 hypothetical protein CUN67_10675 [Pantoea cypripedii]
MKIQINIPGMNVPAFVSCDPDVINRKSLCSSLGLDNVTLCRLEKAMGFERALRYMLDKKAKRT